MILTSPPLSSEVVYSGTPFVQIGSFTMLPGQLIDGVWWGLEAVDGWETPPAVTERTEQRNADHGAWIKDGFYQARDIEIKGLLVGQDRVNLAAAWRSLKAAIPSFDPVLLTVAAVGSPVFQAEVIQSEAPILNHSPSQWEFSFSLIAADPRRYSVDLTTAATGLPLTTGGMTFPLTFPLTLGAVTSSGLIQVTNSGDMPSRPTLTIAGPCPPCTITHSSGRRLSVPDAVPAGRFLTLDVDSRSALLDGTASRVVTGTWFDLDPGVNEIQFSSATYDPSAQLTVSFRSAWR